jgi:hypothetical protein
MVPHWFSSLDPDPHSEKSLIRVETNADPQHCLKPSKKYFSKISVSNFTQKFARNKYVMNHDGFKGTVS